VILPIALPVLLLLVAVLLALRLRRVLQAPQPPAPVCRPVVLDERQRQLLSQLEDFFGPDSRLLSQLPLRELFYLPADPADLPPMLADYLRQRLLSCVVCERDSFAPQAVIDIAPVAQRQQDARLGLLAALHCPCVCLAAEDYSAAALATALQQHFSAPDSAAVSTAGPWCLLS